MKSLIKALFGFLTAGSSVLLANTDAVSSIAGDNNVAVIGAIASIIVGISNWYKHRGE